MKPEDIGKAYDTITHLWESEDFDRSNGIEQHQRALTFLKHKRRALDVGCGCTGRFIELLQAEGIIVEGLDVSECMLDIARRRHPNVKFEHVDVCEWQPQKSYDFITAWDSIWHIPLNQQERVLSKLFASLELAGVMMFSFGATEKRDERQNDVMGPEVYYSSLGTHGILHHLMGLGCVIQHLELDQYPESHAYVIVQKMP